MAAKPVTTSASASLKRHNARPCAASNNERKGKPLRSARARKRDRLSAGTSTRTAAMRRGPSSARPGNGR